jgi:hypothetical protein
VRVGDILRGVTRVGDIRALWRRLGVVGNDVQEDLAVDDIE